jgi:hypothetical protein
MVVGMGNLCVSGESLGVMGVFYPQNTLLSQATILNLKTGGSNDNPIYSNANPSPASPTEEQ